MHKETGEMGEMLPLVKQFGIDKITELTSAEHNAIKDIKQELRPEELAYLRWRDSTDLAEVSFKDAFLAGWNRGQ